jgi:hypothetical protein
MGVTLTPLAPHQGDALERGEVQELKPWSARRTAAFVVAVCGAFWLAVGAGVYWLFTAV